MTAHLAESARRKIELRVGGGFRLPDLTGEPLPRRLITTTFLDTPGRSLARAGITLHCAAEARRSEWQLSLPGGDRPIQLEEEAALGAPPETLVRLLTTHTRHGGVAPVATVCTRRSGVVSTLHEARVAVVLDWIEVISGPDDVPAFGVVEVELLDGERHGLDSAVDALRSAGAVPANGVPAAEALWSRIAPAQRDGGFVAAQLVEILAHDPGTRLGTDPEDLHKHRVAVRRLRAVLRDEPFKSELRWLGGALGAVRDLDVLIEHFGEEAASLEPEERTAFRSVLQRLARRRATARRELGHALDSERYFALLDALEAVPAETDPAGTARHEAMRQFKKLRREAREAGPAPEDATLHELRKRAKRVRYAAERAAAAGDDSLAELGSRAKALQDVLGVHQDAVVGEETLRELAADLIRPAQSLAIGRLIERERAREAAARAAVAGRLAPAQESRLIQVARRVVRAGGRSVYSSDTDCTANPASSSAARTSPSAWNHCRCRSLNGSPSRGRATSIVVSQVRASGRPSLVITNSLPAASPATTGFATVKPSSRRCGGRTRATPPGRSRPATAASVSRSSSGSR